jgi:hypothetical protein
VLPVPGSLLQDHKQILCVTASIVKVFSQKIEAVQDQTCKIFTHTRGVHEARRCAW